METQNIRYLYIYKRIFTAVILELLAQFTLSIHVYNVYKLLREKLGVYHGRFLRMRIKDSSQVKN